jgi:hypothetical protein
VKVSQFCESLCNIEVKDVFFLGVVPFGKRDISEKQLEFCNAMNCSFQQANANEESKFYYHCGECLEKKLFCNTNRKMPRKTNKHKHVVKLPK